MTPPTIPITYIKDRTRFFRKCDRRVWRAFSRNVDHSNSEWRHNKGAGELTLCELLDCQWVESEKKYMQYNRQ